MSSNLVSSSYLAINGKKNTKNTNFFFQIILTYLIFIFLSTFLSFLLYWLQVILRSSSVLLPFFFHYIYFVILIFNFFSCAYFFHCRVICIVGLMSYSHSWNSLHVQGSPFTTRSPIFLLYFNDPTIYLIQHFFTITLLVINPTNISRRPNHMYTPIEYVYVPI